MTSYEEEKKEYKRLFKLISGNFTYDFLPEEFCMWRKKDGSCKRLIDYRVEFIFIKSDSMRDNLAELRMCLDYHLSLYKIAKPGLVFKKHHEFILYQIIGAIYEGIMYDFFEYNYKKNKNEIYRVIAEESIRKRSLGLGKLIHILSEAKIINSKWTEYLYDINSARITVHPKSLNSKKSNPDKNKAMKLGIENMILNLNRFIINIKRNY